MSEKFSWADVHARRRAFAGRVQKDIGLSFPLTGGIEEPFSALMLTDQMLADQPMWHVPFYALAHRMEIATSHHHLIDHAWWLLVADRTKEPWGFVTEPYISQEEAERLASLITRLRSGWGVRAKAWPAELSPWNPGATVPITVTCGVGFLYEFLRLGVGSALRQMTPGF
jgi:hypothetical protein